MLRPRAWLASAAFALAALGNAGCLLVAAGAAGAGAATYAYYNGQLYREYHASLADTAAAARAALADLQFPVIEQKSDTGTTFLKTRTADGHTVRIHLDVVPSPIPAEGALTRVSIRVGFSGDEAVSGRLLEQINLHLAPPGTVRPTPAPATALPKGASLGAPLPLKQETEFRPVAAKETAPPPLAPLVPPATPPVPIAAKK